MKLELTEETNVGNGTMYAIRQDGIAIKWFSQKETAEKFFDEVVANPEILKPVKNILKSQEVVVFLDINNTENNN